MANIKRLIAKLDTEEKIEIFQELYAELEEEERVRLVAQVPHIKPLADYFEKALETLRAPGAITGLHTGYQSLDAITLGFDPQELIIIAGPTGHGKTLLAQNVLYNLARKGIPSLFFSLEMSEIETTQRFLNMHETESRNPEEVGLLPVVYYAGRGDLKPDGIGVQVEAAIKDYGIKIACIDHIHYFARSIQYEREEIDLITRTVKQAARRYDIPIILISHVRKIKDGERAGEGDLKGSSAIAQDADQVIMVNRKKTDPDENVRHTLDIEVTKNRLKGKGGKISMFIDPHWRLKDLTQNAAEVFNA